MTTAGQIERAVAGLHVPDPPSAARRAAVLVLATPDGRDADLVYTRRRDDLRHHPGQISFPGGALDDGESIEAAALREAHEEIGLDPATVRVVGRLPALYIPPSRYWLTPVVALWDEPHPLTPQPSEVAEILHVRLSTLTDPDRLRVVELSSVGRSWAWQLSDGDLLWGATGRVTQTLLDAVAPGWTAVDGPGDLPDDRIVSPWRLEVPGDRPATFAARRLVDLPEASVDDLVAHPDPTVWARQTARVAQALGGTQGSVVVLAGGGDNGALARRVAAALEAAGAAGELYEVGRRTDSLPAADLVIDGLVGRGLDGPLRGRALEVLEQLRTFTPRVLALDLPTGLHPGTGLVGELITADATMVHGLPAEGLCAAGLTVFRGELVGLAATGGGPAAARVPATEAAGWRE